MINQADTLARIYGYILSADWGCNDLPQDQNASLDAANDQGWQLNERVGEPRSSMIIKDGVDRD